MAGIPAGHDDADALGNVNHGDGKVKVADNSDLDSRKDALAV